MNGYRLGIPLPTRLPLRDAIEVAVIADQLGYTDVWSAEVAGFDAFTPLASVAALAPHVRLGTAVVPASTRPPALLAMTAATLHDISGGRFCLGLGSSTPAIVANWMGIPFPPPLARMRETVAAIRRALDGEKVIFEGATLAVRGFRLENGARAVPIMIGALGPAMMRLAGAIADGLVLTMAARDAIPALLAQFREGARSAGRDPDALDVVLTVPVALDQAPAVRDQLRGSIAAYGVLDVYNRYLERQGFEQEAAALRDARERRSRTEAAAAVSDRMLRALSVSGGLRSCREQLTAYRAAGIKTLLVSPVVAAVETDERKAQFLDTLRRLTGC